jgi:hypothetical protein
MEEVGTSDFRVASGDRISCGAGMARAARLEVGEW